MNAPASTQMATSNTTGLKRQKNAGAFA
jgi:hypothetical protein